ncbi:hypothetical protein RHSIM_Rhsim07G0033200 [Rhododendron simsii]|uniref:Carotenoid cleavage dioxygenase 7 n=1 Tax=Rhododendron simsii TaxID=118357 RepID=A0A834H000_RHOSS|nr:hypothetical protein RHSIM_Rhsim07G0033200 [Rhododendron simsii]
MQVKSCHIIQPISAASPAKSLLPANKVSLPVKTPRAISITAPSDLVSTTDVIDDSTAAFRDYQSLWVSQRSETAAPVTLRVVDGAIPADFPPGTYYLTGPGLFSDDHGSTVHPLDGHGYLRTFTIDGAKGEAKFMARYIETEAQVEERDPETGRWRFTHRGPFSVLKGGRMVGNTKVMKNVANTSVVKWGGRLLCLWEGGEPYEIVSRTLETVGKVDVINGGGDQSTFRGGRKADVWDVAAAMLKPILYGVFNMPPKRFLSHYKIDARRNRLMILSCNAEDMLLPRSHFTFYEFDTNFKLVQRREFTIPEHLMIHDWAFTDSHYILFGNRIKLDITGSMAAVCGLSPMISALTVNPSKPTSPIYLLPRFPAPVDDHDQNYSVLADQKDYCLTFPPAHGEQSIVVPNTDILSVALLCSTQWQHEDATFAIDWMDAMMEPIFNCLNFSSLQCLPRRRTIFVEIDAVGNASGSLVDDVSIEWVRGRDFTTYDHCAPGSDSTAFGSSITVPNLFVEFLPWDTSVFFCLKSKYVETWACGTMDFKRNPKFTGANIPFQLLYTSPEYVLVLKDAMSHHIRHGKITEGRSLGEEDLAYGKTQPPVVNIVKLLLFCGPEGNALVYELAERALDGPISERIKEYISQIVQKDAAPADAD